MMDGHRRGVAGVDDIFRTDGVWSRRRQKKLRKMVDEGLSDDVIALRLATSRSEVERVIANNGWRANDDRDVMAPGVRMSDVRAAVLFLKSVRVEIKGPNPAGVYQIVMRGSGWGDMGGTRWVGVDGLMRLANQILEARAKDMGVPCVLFPEPAAREVAR